MFYGRIWEITIVGLPVWRFQGNILTNELTFDLP